MRLLRNSIFILMVVAPTAFWALNASNRTTVSFLNTVYRDVSLPLVVVISFGVGAVLTAIIAVAEGTKVRFENRRLRKEVSQLETEVNYLRTQPSTSRPEPDEPTATLPVGAERPALEGTPPSAPVYDSGDDWSPEGDDDMYTGGRAV